MAHGLEVAAARVLAPAERVGLPVGRAAGRGQQPVEPIDQVVQPVGDALQFVAQFRVNVISQ
jgi:hypothetical protein